MEQVDVKGVAVETFYIEAIALLKQLISTPSFSREEDRTAEIIRECLSRHHVPSEKYLNNVWSKNRYFDNSRPVVLLNSHHDTVRPNAGYSVDPFDPVEADGKLFGLGSNDAGGAVVCLLAAFLYFYDRQDLPFNLVFAATAEEEISGHQGVEILLPELPPVTCGIVGEPTLLKMAVAEKGLLVLDCVAHGVAGHAARNEGVNAIYKAITDIRWFQHFSFPRTSPYLGPVHMAVTSVQTTNTAHNVVPSECCFVVDIRVNEQYTFEELLAEIRLHVGSEITPRSTRLRPSFIDERHPLVLAGRQLGLDAYGSPTCSDRALMNFPTLKLGPGDSARSHSADEYIFTEEIRQGITVYIQLLEQLKSLL